MFLSPEEVEKNFTPTYRPWRQRIAFVPDGDIFQGIRAGKASVVTDEIERFVEDGVLLKSGKTIKADIVVTATGFNLNALGDIDFEIDGKPLNFADTVTYRGMMFTGVPNLVWVFGYFRASWTLRADLIGDFVCRLLGHMDERGREEGRGSAPPRRPRHAAGCRGSIPENFNPGYLMRGMHLLPKRGDKPEWRHTQDYWARRTPSPPSISTPRSSSTTTANRRGRRPPAGGRGRIGLSRPGRRATRRKRPHPAAGSRSGLRSAGRAGSRRGRTGSSSG